MANDDLALLTGAAHDAGQIALRHLNAGPKVWDKPDGQGPVTDADLEIDRMLQGALCTARPDYGWLSEESRDTPDRLGRARVFIVDPIDGTRAFAQGQQGFAHALAVVEHGQPIAAVIHLPVPDLTYHALRGHGAFLNGSPIRTTDRHAVTGARVLATRSQLAAEHWQGGAPLMTPHFRPSLAWRMALVAEGQFDAMLSLRPTWHWDIVAGALLIAEAGGKVSDGAGQDLLFNTKAPVSDGIIAAGAVMHDALLDLRIPPQSA
ncbi:3'(2'),5'-bisphosphate nucleotidase CysQ [Roseinatronobacter sp. HJB301]|uniref:3'(2'),5'-bisphosphate nucleotidase CysQ n=1 Tax=Roseinatronobacter alkalisoli TaxID=3028235 RepID=A0ABT5T4F2_9RHOB|nr:3'(2'),5'-bisphosphate nucleotidase CysQ [Roseinatronobacter sp. HJB301]MDD7970001.1 3'(2'),5'-bisphosphate nucleotidase CysQ [Roseinatronobacter sp. HJB301]